MATLRDLLSQKGGQIFGIGKDASVLDAAIMMNEHKIGALVVCNGECEGMFTERDMLRRVVAERRDPAKTKVNDVMTRDIVVGTPDMDIEEARSIMKTRRIRHLPIVDDGRVVGMISIGDLNAWDLDGQERTILHMKEYIYGRV